MYCSVGLDCPRDPLAAISRCASLRLEPAAIRLVCGFFPACRYRLLEGFAALGTVRCRPLRPARLRIFGPGNPSQFGRLTHRSRQTRQKSTRQYYNLTTNHVCDKLGLGSSSPGWLPSHHPAATLASLGLNPLRINTYMYSAKCLILKHL